MQLFRGLLKKAGSTTDVNKTTPPLDRKEGFENELARILPRLTALANNLSDSKEDALDLIQDTSFRAWQRLGSFRGESSLYTWMRTILIREAGQKMKAKSRTVLEFQNEVSAALTSEDPRWQPELNLETTVLRDSIVKAISELPEHYRVVYFLREVEEMSYMEIAESLNIPEGTVKSRLAAARLALRKKLMEV